MAGVAWLSVRTFAKGEEIPKIHDHARPVSMVISRLADGQPHRSKPPAMFSEKLDDAIVPRAVLESLPPDTIVAIDWEFLPEGEADRHDNEDHTEARREDHTRQNG